MDKVYISFENTSSAERNKLALELQEYLLIQSTEEVDIIKEDENTQDFGATLSIILGSSAAVALSKGIADWLRKRRSVMITVKNGEQEIIAQNLTSKDTAILLDKFQKLTIDRDTGRSK